MVAYRDEYNATTGIITRNVGIKVLDGTENWAKSFANAGLFYLSGARNSWGTFSNAIGVCNHVRFVTVSQCTQNTCCFDSDFNFWNGNFDASTTVTQFKQWLADQYAAGTPVIVVYPLAQAVTEQVAPQVLNVQAGDNILEITQASLSNLELEAKYKKQA